VSLLALVSTARAHDNTRPAALREVAFDQKLAEQVPLDLAFRDERGNEVRLGDYFGRKPVILNFVYFKCRDLCPLLLDGVVRALRTLSFDIGNQFDVLTARPGAANGWHFLTGAENSIEKLTRAVGFHYNYDAQTGEFAHATGIVLLTPAGKVSRYYYGIDFSPRDLRLGLIEAAEARIGTPIDQLLLFCFHYDPVTGKYGLLVTNVIRLAGGLTVLLLAGFVIALLRRERSHAGANKRTA
jgi:protein SCO1